MALNTYSDISSIAPDIQEDALFVIRETYQMQSLITTYRDMSGLNPRKGYEYNQTAAYLIGESDDLTSTAFNPSLLATLTPQEIGLQFFVTDSRVESESPDNIRTDGGRELGFAAGDKIESDILGDFSSFTGGTVGAAGTAITWGYVAAGIARARNASKSPNVPLSCVIHGYQWAVLAKAATIAGATVAATAPGFQEQLTRSGYVASFMGVPMYQVYGAPNSLDDFTGAVFPRTALAIDWRRAVRVEAERDASRRGTEFNMSAVYAHGVWRAALGVQLVFDATAPTS